MMVTLSELEQLRDALDVWEAHAVDPQLAEEHEARWAARLIVERLLADARKTNGRPQ